MRECVALLLCACGRLDFEAGVADARGEDAPEPLVDGPSGFGPFEAPMAALDLNSSQDDSSITMSEDGLVAVLVLNNDTLMSTQRATRTSAFDVPTAITELNTPSSERDPELSDDGLVLCFERNGALHQAVRATRTAPFGAPTTLFGSTTEFYSPQTPSISRDGLEMIVAAELAGTTPGSPLDLFLLDRSDRLSPFTFRRRLDELDTTFDERGQALTSDGLEIVFATNRDGEPALYRATRPDRSSPFSAPVRLVEFSGGFDHADTFFETDEKLWFTSNRPGTSGPYDLWFSTRTRR